MKKVYLHTDTILSPIGLSTKENIASLKQGITGISKIDDHYLNDKPFYASKISSSKLHNALKPDLNSTKYTKLELLLIMALQPIFDSHSQEIDEQTSLIISTTKGNIDVLNKQAPHQSSKSYLFTLSETLQAYFKLKRAPIIVSNACISGALALTTAHRLINSGYAKNAIVVAGDILSKFTLSGFFSFNAISHNPCKPFSKQRDGITLGEAAAAVFISTTPSKVALLGGATVNDANHISGPSKTGEGLSLAIKRVLKNTNLNAEHIDYISPHGTATLYNDAMESTAFKTLGLDKAIINPVKGYYGHTLGASALIEALICKHAIIHQMSFTSLGYSSNKAMAPLTFSTSNQKLTIDYALNTASGFGGCNIAQLLKREDH